MLDFFGTPITDAGRRILREAYAALGGPLRTGAYVPAILAERLELDRTYLILACERLLEVFPDGPAKRDALTALAVMKAAGHSSNCGDARFAPVHPAYDDLPHTTDNPAHGLGGD